MKTNKLAYQDWQNGEITFNEYLKVVFTKPVPPYHSKYLTIFKKYNLALKEIQELQETIETYERRVLRLQNKIKKLEGDKK